MANGRFDICLATIVLVAMSLDASAQWKEPSQKAGDARGGPAEQEDVDLRETGFYQAGPRVGAFEGASGTWGLRGGGFTLPEIRLALPEIEFPSLFHRSRQAKMVYDGGEAPWTSTGFQRVSPDGAEPREGPGVDREGPRDKSLSRSDAECEQLRRLQQEYYDKIDELERKLQNCDRLSQQLEQQVRNGQQAAVFKATDDSLDSFKRLPSVADGMLHHSAPRSYVARQSPGWIAGPEVTPATHWATVGNSEPRGLRRLPEAEVSIREANSRVLSRSR